MSRPIEPTRLKQEAGGIWYLHYFDESKGRTRRKSLETTDLGTAERKRAFWITAEAVDVDGDPLIDDMLDLYWREHARKNTDARRAEQRITALRKHLGKLPVSQIDNDTVEVYSEKRADGTKKGTIATGTLRGDLQILKAALNHNKVKKRIKVVPMFTLPDPSPVRERWLSSAEIKRLLDTAEARRGKHLGKNKDRLSRLERFCWIALETAARKTAIATLTWDRVNFRTTLIDFREPGRKETKKRRAVVPISKRLLPILQRAYKERRTEYVLDTPTKISSNFDHLVAGARLKGVTPHTLRHTAATHMAQAGVPLFKIARVLGNTIAMVDRVYAKHQPGHLRDAVDYEREEAEAETCDE